MKSQCLLLVLSTHYDFYIHQIDVTMAFLNGVFKERIYFTQPKGFVIFSHKNKICHLFKSSYGLKQAPHIWYD